MEEIRKIIREEIIRAAKIYHKKVAHYEKQLITPDGSVWYGMRPATIDEKLELFVKLLEENE